MGGHNAIKFLHPAAVLGAFVLFSPGPLRAGERNPRIIPAAIYGNLDNREIYETEPARRELARSVPALFPAGNLSHESGGAYAIKLSTKSGKTVGEAYGMSPGEKFFDQIIGADCSGALVGDDLVLTAGHCVPKSGRGVNCESADREERGKVIFGFFRGGAGDIPPKVFPERDVYLCERIITSANRDDKGGPDYALIQLDRKVTGRIPLAINRAGSIFPGDKVFSIAYPFGISARIAENAQVRRMPGGEPYYTTDLDSFRGASGGPVFNAGTLRIEGLVTSGDREFARGMNGTVLRIFPQDGGAGTGVDKLDPVKDFIPVTEMEKALDAKEKTDRDGTPSGSAAPAIYFQNSDGARIPAVHGPAPARRDAELSV